MLEKDATGAVGVYNTHDLQQNRLQR